MYVCLNAWKYVYYVYYAHVTTVFSPQCPVIAWLHYSSTIHTIQVQLFVNVRLGSTHSMSVCVSVKWHSFYVGDRCLWWC